MPRIYKVKDYAGMRFNSLVILKMIPHAPNTPRLCLAKCDCGSEVTIRIAEAVIGRSKRCYPCGRLKTALKNTTHGVSNTSYTAYKSWENMKARCLNKNSTSYKYYGGRGILICQEWIDSFETFLHDMGERPTGTSLDRINPEGNYERSNCRWADRKTQARNKRSTARNNS